MDERPWAILTHGLFIFNALPPSAIDGRGRQRGVVEEMIDGSNL